MPKIESTLLPCPFCGGHAVACEKEIRSYDSQQVLNQWHEVQCKSCEAKTGCAGSLLIPRTDTAAQAIELWNRRKEQHAGAPAPSEQDVAVLAAEVSKT